MDKIEFKQIRFTVFEALPQHLGGEAKIHTLIGHESLDIGVFTINDGCADIWKDSLDNVEAPGGGVIVKREYTGEVASFPTRGIITSIEDSINEYGVDYVPHSCLAFLWSEYSHLAAVTQDLIDSVQKYESDTFNGDHLGVTREEAKLIVEKLILSRIDFYSNLDGANLLELLEEIREDASLQH